MLMSLECEKLTQLVTLKSIGKIVMWIVQVREDLGSILIFLQVRSDFGAQWTNRVIKLLSRVMVFNSFVSAKFLFELEFAR